PSGPESDAWLALAVKELLREIEDQFYPEGTNVEASTSYHRLSGEMAVYSLALILGLPQERTAGPVALPESLGRKLAGMAEFTRDCSAPDGLVAQFGDNDSGRFFKLPGTYRRLDASGAKRYRVPDLSRVHGEYWDEDLLD